MIMRQTRTPVAAAVFLFGWLCAVDLLRLAMADVGTATSYDPPYLPTRCPGYGKDQLPDGGQFLAAGNGIWDNDAACGRRYRLRCLSGLLRRLCKDGFIVVEVVDVCRSNPCPSTMEIMFRRTTEGCNTDAAAMPPPLLLFLLFMLFLVSDGGGIAAQQQQQSQRAMLELLTEINAVTHFRASHIYNRCVTPLAVFPDSDKNPRLGCFALAEFLTRNNHGNHHVATTTSVCGIFGYMTPEYVESGGDTTKANVYSFGVVVLEVVSRQRAVDLRQPEVLLASKVRRFLASKKPLEGLLDWRLGEEYDRPQLARLARLGFLCTHSNLETRSSMRQVVTILDGNDQLLESLEGRKKEGMEEGRGRSAASPSLIRRMHALGIH